VPDPRILAVIVPDEAYCAATSGSERFIIVFEKKVRASMTTRKTIIAFFTQALFFTVCSFMY